MVLFLVQVELLVERMVGWIKVGGYIFFRESCFHQSGDSKRKSNPTHYREPRFYTKVLTFSELHFQIYQWNTEVHSRRRYAGEKMQVFQECVTRDAAGNSFELSMIGQKCIGAYVKNKKNQNQVKLRLCLIRIIYFLLLRDL